MDRIQHPSATSDNLFTEGNPALGIPATTVTATVLNGWQEELIHLIEAAGIEPSAADNAQVLQALQELFQPRGVTTDVRIFTVLTADFISGAKTLDIGGLGEVVVIVQGNGSGPHTLTLSGVIPAGVRATVVNWSPATLTVATAVSGTGSAEPLALYDWAQLVMGAGQTRWFNLSVKDSKNVRTETASAVYAESSRAQAEEADIRNDLGTMISSESGRAQAEEGQIRIEVDRVAGSEELSTGWATYGQSATYDVYTLSLDPENVYEILGVCHYSIGPGELSGPEAVCVTFRDGSNTLLERFGTGKITRMDSADPAEEKMGTIPLLYRVSGISSLKIQVYGMVGTGGGANYTARVNLLTRRTNRT